MNACVITASTVTAIYIIIVAIWYRKRFPKSKPKKHRGLLEENEYYDCPGWADTEKWEERRR